MTDWKLSKSVPELTAGEVHIWRIRLDISDDDWQALTSMLSDDEQIKAKRFHYEKHRRRYIVGRAALRTLLGQYLDLQPKSIEFTYNSHGKPGLADGSSGMRFNLSHTEEIMLAAFVMGSDIGIDIESIMRDVDCTDIGQRWFSDMEGRTLQALPDYARHDAFFRTWSRKEAYIKARGEGISHLLHRFSVSVDEHEPRLIEHQDDAGETIRWRFIDIDAGEKYRATVVVESADWKLRLHSLCRPPFQS